MVQVGALKAFHPDWRTAQGALDSVAPGGSIFAGYAWQREWLVFGLEGDVGHAHGDKYRSGLISTDWPGDSAGSPDSTVIEQGWNASARLKAGAVLGDRALIFVTAGLGLEQVSAHLSCSNFGFWCTAPRYQRESGWNAGWTVGGGLEVLVTDRVFVRGAYRYSDLGRMQRTFFSASDGDDLETSLRVTDQAFTIGAGVRF